MLNLILSMFSVYLTGISLLVLEDINFYRTRKEYELCKLNEQRIKLHMNPLYSSEFSYNKKKLTNKELLMSWFSFFKIRKEHLDYKNRYGIKI